jgi:20S proteasome subunit alpha 1
LSEGTASFLGDDVRHIGKNVEETLELAVGTLASVLSLELKPADLEIGLVTRQEPEFRVLSDDEIERLLTRMVEKE